MKQQLAMYVLVSLAVEVGVLIAVARLTSGTFILLWLIGAAVLGLGLIRVAGLSSLVRGGLPSGGRRPDPLRALVYTMAGVFLVAPGMISDALALLILFPPIRNWVRRAALRRLQNRFAGLREQMLRDADPGDVVDAESSEPRSAPRSSRLK